MCRGFESPCALSPKGEIIAYNDTHFKESCRLVRNLVEAIQIEEPEEIKMYEEQLEFHLQKLTDKQNEKILSYYADLFLNL